MNFINIFISNFKLMCKSIQKVILTTLMPFVVILGIAFIMNPSNSQIEPTYYFVDNDNTEYSKNFIDKLNEKYVISINTEDYYVDKIAKGGMDTYYVIPSNFSSYLKDNSQVSIEVVKTDESNKNMLFENYMISILNKLNRIELINKSTGSSLTIEKLNDTTSVSFTKDDSMSRMILGLILSFNTFASIGIVYDVLEQRRSKTLRRALVTPNRTRAIIGGLFSANYVFLALSYIGLFLVYGFGFNKAILNDSAIIITSLLVMSGISLSIGVLGSRILKNEALISIVMQIFGMVTCYVSGLWVPLEILPSFIKPFSKLMPQYWIMEAINNTNYIYLLIATLFGVAFFTAGTLSSKSYADE